MRPTDPENSPSWLEDAMAGDFTTMPRPFTWAQSAAFAHIIDGYGIAGGVVECLRIARSAIDNEVDPNCRATSAVNLWVALFGEHRACRHFGYPPGPPELLYLDALCDELRQRLQNLSAEDLNEVRAVMAAHPGYSVVSKWVWRP